MDRVKSLLLAVAERILSNWTVLKLAVENGMGPIESALEFCSYVTEVLCMNDGLTVSQIVGELEYYMNDQFNTELQDDGTIQVARELLRFYQYCVDGDEFTAVTELEKLPASQPWLNLERLVRPTLSQLVKYYSSSDEDMDVDRSEQEKDGWTVSTNKQSK